MNKNVALCNEMFEIIYFFSSCDFLEVRTFLRGTLLLFSLDLEEIFRLVAGEEGTGILVSVFDDVDKDC